MHFSLITLAKRTTEGILSILFRGRDINNRRVGSRHFENLWDSSWGFLLCIACPAMQAVSRPHPIKTFCGAKTKPWAKRTPYWGKDKIVKRAVSETNSYWRKSTKNKSKKTKNLEKSKKCERQKIKKSVANYCIYQKKTVILQKILTRISIIITYITINLSKL